tara:strand:- start:2720 stop:3217 length:498 start_codon:yes stop_codon:yes gene_type:complete
MYHRYYLNKKPRKTPVYKPREKEFNFLKNWRIVRYYIQKRYGLTLSELEMLLFLYDEKLFDKSTFFSFANCMSWDRNRFSDMKKRELISVWREGKITKHRELYQLSQKAKLICSHTYKKLVGQELISEDPYRNNIMKGTTYTDKVYRNLIKKMNSKTTADSHNDK